MFSRSFSNLPNAYRNKCVSVCVCVRYLCKLCNYNMYKHLKCLILILANKFCIYDIRKSTSLKYLFTTTIYKILQRTKFEDKFFADSFLDWEIIWHAKGQWHILTKAQEMRNAELQCCSLHVALQRVARLKSITKALINVYKP